MKREILSLILGGLTAVLIVVGDSPKTNSLVVDSSILIQSSEIKYLSRCTQNNRNTLTSWDSLGKGGLKISYLCFCNGIYWVSIPEATNCTNGLCSPASCLVEPGPITLGE